MTTLEMRKLEDLCPRVLTAASGWINAQTPSSDRGALTDFGHRRLRDHFVCNYNIRLGSGAAKHLRYMKVVDRQGHVCDRSALEDYITKHVKTKVV